MLKRTILIKNKIHYFLWKWPWPVLLRNVLYSLRMEELSFHKSKTTFKYNSTWKGSYVYIYIHYKISIVFTTHSFVDCHNWLPLLMVSSPADSSPSQVLRVLTITGCSLKRRRQHVTSCNQNPNLDWDMIRRVIWTNTAIYVNQILDSLGFHYPKEDMT